MKKYLLIVLLFGCGTLCAFSDNTVRKDERILAALIQLWIKGQTGDRRFGIEIYKSALEDVIDSAHNKKFVVSQTSRDILNNYKLLERDCVNQDAQQMICFLFPQNIKSVKSRL